MKIIGKVLFYKMLADIPVGTTVYVDEYGIVLYNNQLLLCVQYPYAEKYSMESGHVIPITRTSQDEDGFLIDFTKVSLHLPQRTLSLQDWKECLADKGEYIGPYQVETIEYNPKDYAEVYSRFSFSELLGELILINSSLFLGKDVDECKIQLKVLKRFFRKELESTSIEVLREMKNQFSMDLFEGEEYASTGNQELHDLVQSLLARTGDSVNEFQEMPLEKLEPLLKEALANNQFERCAKIRDAIKAKKV